MQAAAGIWGGAESSDEHKIKKEVEAGREIGLLPI
jgi:hypothetical protein